MHPNDLQLSALPYNSPTNLALHGARQLQRVERMAPAMYPFELLWALGSMALTDLLLDKIEARLLATKRLK